MSRRHKEEKIFWNEEIPREYLQAPREDKYFDQLEQLYKKRREASDFSRRNFGPSTEKFYRLYFYQGSEQQDRLLLHTELMEARARRFWGIGMTLVSGGVTYLVMSQTFKFRPYQMLRFAASCGVGYLFYFNYKMYSLYKLESVVEPLFAKYAIK